MSSWKDTVMNKDELDKAFDGDFGEVAFDHQPTAEDIFLIKLELVAQTQAEITGKIMKQEGRREVERYVNRNIVMAPLTHSNWQAKLKDWEGK